MDCDQIEILAQQTGYAKVALSPKTGAPRAAGPPRERRQVVDGKIFNTDEGGTTFVIEATSTFKLLHKNTLEEMTWSSPAIAGGAVYLRTVGKLYCLAGGAETAQNISSLPNQVLTLTP